MWNLQKIAEGLENRVTCKFWNDQEGAGPRARDEGKIQNRERARTTN